MKNLTSLNLSNLDTSNAANMAWMFSDCEKLQNITFGNKFRTTVNTITMHVMFYNCNSLTSLDLSNFNSTNAKSMQNMFLYCGSLTSINMGSNFKVTSECTNMYAMFSNCSSLKTLDLSSFDTRNVTTLQWTFYECSSLTSLNLNGFNTSSVTDMGYTFSGCSSLTSLNLSSFNTNNVTLMHGMFNNTSNLKELDISSFNTANVTDMNGMFFGNNLNKIKLGAQTNLHTNENGGYPFGRGTWKKLEDGEEYSLVEICDKSTRGEAAGTYIKISNISKEMNIEYTPTLKIDTLSHISSINSQGGSFQLVDNKVFAKNIPYTATDVYNVPGSVEVRFNEVVNDTWSENNSDLYNKYDLILKISNIKIYDLAGANGDTNSGDFMILESGENGTQLANQWDGISPYKSAHT